MGGGLDGELDEESRRTRLDGEGREAADLCRLEPLGFNATGYTSLNSGLRGCESGTAVVTGSGDMAFRRHGGAECGAQMAHKDANSHPDGRLDLGVDLGASVGDSRLAKRASTQSSILARSDSADAPRRTRGRVQTFDGQEHSQGGRCTHASRGERDEAGVTDNFEHSELTFGAFSFPHTLPPRKETTCSAG